MTTTFADIQSAALRLKGIAHRTPVLQSHAINALIGAEVYFKCENFQRAGAFKFRGAYYAVSELASRGGCAGVLTYSSGNHAQAIALAAQLHGLLAVIVMPNNAPAVKLEATRGYGAEVVLYDPKTTAREALASTIAAKRGLALIPPFDHDDVIAGQGTVALELLEDVPNLDALLVCMGGGGLLSGSAIAAKALRAECQVFGVEPEAGNDGKLSFDRRVLVQHHNPNTIADGARTAPCLRTMAIIWRHVDDIFLVSDAELIAAMRLVMARLKIVVEPTGVLASAGLLKHAQQFAGKRVGVIVSGGNVALDQLAGWLA